MTLEIKMEQTTRLLHVTHPELGIDVFATTLESLLVELQEQLVMLWREYALASDADLDAPARQLKQALLARFGSGCAILVRHTFSARLA
jgi:hypothetical protein